MKALKILQQLKKKKKYKTKKKKPILKINNSPMSCTTYLFIYFD